MIHFAEYKIESNNITKDGHAMFLSDVLTDLRRKSFLEGKVLQSAAPTNNSSTPMQEGKMHLNTYHKINHRLYNGIMFYFLYEKSNIRVFNKRCETYGSFMDEGSFFKMYKRRGETLNLTAPPQCCVECVKTFNIEGNMEFKQQILDKLQDVQRSVDEKGNNIFVHNTEVGGELKVLAFEIGMIRAALIRRFKRIKPQYNKDFM